MISIGLGLLIAAGASFAGSLINWSESSAARREAREMDDRNFAYNKEIDARNFAWQQAKDRFGMEATNRQLGEQRRMNNYSVVSDQINRLNDVLKTNVGLRDRMLALWGGKK
jgi:hypothetical protein